MQPWSKIADGTVAAGMKAFGEPINYQPLAAAAFDLASNGVFTAEFETIVETPEGQVASTAPMLGVRLADFPVGQPPRKGDQLTRTESGTSYRVREVQPDGVAGAALILFER